jgi:predicted P-loop ATPase
MTPGCKYDYLTVLESPEGRNKSSALEALYGAEYFSDQTILGLHDKELAETVRGRWCIECAELSGMKKADIDKVKAQITRQVDRARAAYDRYVTDSSRQCVFWGSTNDDEYLRSQTGNRRFLPVKIKRADVAAIKRDRDQLWAEAYELETLGEPITLAENLWAAAGVEQNKRTEQDPWQDALADVVDQARAYEAEREKNSLEMVAPVYMITPGGEERITSHYLLGSILEIPINQQNAEHGKRLGRIMKKMEWEGPKLFKIEGKAMKGYTRTDPSA